MNIGRIRYIITVLYCFTVITTVEAFTTGVLDWSTNLGTTHVSRAAAFFYEDKISYVNGGITVTYPVGLFTSAPMITLALELTGLTYLVTQLVSAQVTANSATSTTIRVNVFNLTGLLGTELATGGVNVHFRAEGQ
jgi:hypothetical protein